MVPNGHFSVAARNLAKQQARDRDERLIASGQVSAQQVGRRNSLFSALDPRKARIVRHRAEVRLG